MMIKAYDREHLIDLFEIPAGHTVRVIEDNEGVRLSIDRGEGDVLFIPLETSEDPLLGKRSLYRALAAHYTTTSDWGILVGVRPMKILHGLYDEGCSEEKARRILAETYLISEEKIDLMVSVADRERPVLTEGVGKKMSLYVGIPFCPTRCTYCSFASNAIDKKSAWVAPYLEAVLKEAAATIRFFTLRRYAIDDVYIGGGTPTSITPDQLDHLITGLFTHLDREQVRSFTVEAGRPLTVTDAMLDVLEKHGVDRICLNPQTMSDETLVRIHRGHSAADFVEAYRRATARGRFTVNADLILGLPGEGLAEVRDSVDRLCALAPEQITVHTLSLKRGASLSNRTELLERDALVTAMMATASEKLEAAGYGPYYLYRQKKMIGHLENVGFTRGAVNRYNIRIMGERHMILALGAGSASKWSITPDHFERFSNTKGLEQYVRGIDALIEKKLASLEALYPLDAGGGNQYT